jgi:hypothetical protein
MLIVEGHRKRASRLPTRWAATMRNFGLLRCNPASVQLPVSRTPTSPGPREAFTPALTYRAADRLSSEDEAHFFAPFPEC